MKNYNTIEIPFDLDKFKNKEEFNHAVGAVVGLLTDLDYVMKISNDGYTTAIQFNLDPDQFGGPKLLWCDEDEDVYSESEMKEIEKEIREDLQENIEREPYRIWANKLASFVEENEVDYMSFIMNNRDKKIEDLSISEAIELVQKEKEREREV